jgi:hypothetical protein
VRKAELAGECGSKVFSPEAAGEAETLGVLLTSTT